MALVVLMSLVALPIMADLAVLTAVDSLSLGPYDW